MRATVTTLGLTAALLVLLPSVALAHASFDVRQLPAERTQDVVLRVPLERAADNDLVEVLVPGDFTVTDCAAAAGWTCQQAATAEGDTVLRLAREPEGAGDVEGFGLTLLAPAIEGVYAFPTIQTYGDGVEAAWIGEPGSDQPAPRIQVGDETTAVEFSGVASPHTDLAPAETAETAPSPATTPSPPPEANPTSTAAPAADEPTTAPTEPDTTARAGDDDRADGGAPATDDGPSVGLVLVGLVLAAVVVAGAVARLRSR